ncbi:phage portal protein [Glutamicibacter sp. TV12E]|uniref:phage portal protein n=1 Tax=Glutamicibacter sp. TV12E TaxID=3446362 RepID=UPI0040334FAF
MSLRNLQGIIPENHYKEIVFLHERIISLRTVNAEKESFYESSNRVKDLGIAVPPTLKNVDLSLDWCTRSVDSVASRMMLEGFVAETDLDEQGLAEILKENNFITEASAMFTSALLHGVGFVLTYEGNEELGEPKTILRPVAGTHATGRWNPNSRRLSSGLVILDEDKNGNPIRLFFSTPKENINLRYEEQVWIVEAAENPLNKVPLFPVRINPSLTQPFGKSRITKAQMNLTDQALRTMLRMEVTSEFFSAPQRYILGASPEMFEDEEGNPTDTWKLTLGRLLAAPENEETGENPEVGQFAAASPEPHLAVLRQLTQNFAGASSLPPSELGLNSDANPTSAESVRAQIESLLVIVRDTQKSTESGLQDAVIAALQLHNDLDVVPDEYRSLTVRWGDPSTPTLASQADAVSKLVGSGILDPQSELILERLGFSDSDILRVKNERARAQAPGRLAEVLQGRSTPATEKDTTAQDEAAVLKTKADALGLLRRAGVEAESAAELVGLTGVTFIPGNPITIRTEEG